MQCKHSKDGLHNFYVLSKIEETDEKKTETCEV